MNQTALTKTACKFSICTKRLTARSKMAHDYIENDPRTKMDEKQVKTETKGQHYWSFLCDVLDIMCAILYLGYEPFWSFCTRGCHN